MFRKRTVGQKRVATVAAEENSAHKSHVFCLAVSVIRVASISRMYGASNAFAERSTSAVVFGARTDAHASPVTESLVPRGQRLEC